MRGKNVGMHEGEDNLVKIGNVGEIEREGIRDCRRGEEYKRFNFKRYEISESSEHKKVERQME